LGAVSRKEGAARNRRGGVSPGRPQGIFPDAGLAVKWLGAALIAGSCGILPSVPPGVSGGMTMAEPDREQVLARLKRIEGQVRGLQRMVQENRECEEILIQLAAVRAAMQRVSAMVLARSVGKCLPERLSRETEAALRRLVEAYARLG
jgi:DNA-binding FrmR family transcriptional regulator